MLTGNNGIITKAGEARDKTEEADFNEKVQVEVLGSYDNTGNVDLDKVEENVKKNIKPEPTVEKSEDGKKLTIISSNGKYTYVVEGENKEVGSSESGNTIPTDEEKVKTASGNNKGYVGYYADVDGNETVDGIIYADLAVTVTDGRWSDDWGDYSYSKPQGSLKEYTISQESYNGDFGTKPVLKAVNSTGADRFYVMALKDVALDGTSTAERNSIYWNWYYDAYGKLDESMKIPSTGEGSDDFGQGKSKTQTMITKWNQEAYGKKNVDGTYKDLWGIFNHTNNTIGTVDSSKWFIPSKGEWSAFGGNLEITTSNYVNFELSDWYWSSSQYRTDTAYLADFGTGYMNYRIVNSYYYVRLSTTF